MAEKNIIGVGELNDRIKSLLESGFEHVWISGEISNFSRPRSGHWYFSLKDDAAQIRCVMFRHRNQYATLEPEDGMQVLAQGKPGLYAPRGDCQLLVEKMEASGAGSARLAFEQIKRKLAAEGLFDPRHKKPLPKYPSRLGVLTSASGAAIHDVLRVLRRRWPLSQVMVYPALVQGRQAAAELTQALDTANRRQECDLLLLTRGGGSAEDLSPFNDEALARAIFASAIPVVAAIGHEIDFTIADFVADARAATPSAAAEQISPDSEALTQYLDDREAVLIRQVRNRLQQAESALRHATRHLIRQHPRQRIAYHRQRYIYLATTLLETQRHILERRRERLQRSAQALQTLSPLATLGRGYAIAKKVIDDGKGHIHERVVYDSTGIAAGDQVRVILHQGTLRCKVQEKS